MSCHDTDGDHRVVGKSARYYRRLKGSTDMPNLCLLCNESFISSAALAQHLIGKHSDLDCYECTYCGKKGKQKNNVKTYCNKRHENVDFEVIKINENATDSFIQKNSFKGTLVEYRKRGTVQTESKQRKVKKVIKKTHTIVSDGNSSDDSVTNTDIVSLASVDSDISSDISEEINYDKVINFDITNLICDTNSTLENMNIQVRIPILLNEKLANLLESKFGTYLKELEVLSSISGNK